MNRWLDPKSFIIGILFTLLCLTLLGAGYDSFSAHEIVKLKAFAERIQSNGDLDMRNNKIIMLGSSIYDDGTQGGGLQIKGGANRVHIFGDMIIDSQIYSRSNTVRINSNLDLNNRRIIMLGSSIYDDGSEGGGLQLHGGASRIQFFGQTIQR